jgi:hypothetical protein
LVANKAHHPKQTEQISTCQESKRTESPTSFELLTASLFLPFKTHSNRQPELTKNQVENVSVRVLQICTKLSYYLSFTDEEIAIISTNNIAIELVCVRKIRFRPTKIRFRPLPASELHNPLVPIRGLFFFFFKTGTSEPRVCYHRSASVCTFGRAATGRKETRLPLRQALDEMVLDQAPVRAFLYGAVGRPTGCRGRRTSATTGARPAHETEAERGELAGTVPWRKKDGHVVFKAGTARCVRPAGFEARLCIGGCRCCAGVQGRRSTWGAAPDPGRRRARGWRNPLTCVATFFLLYAQGNPKPATSLLPGLRAVARPKSRPPSSRPAAVPAPNPVAFFLPARHTSPNSCSLSLLLVCPPCARTGCHRVLRPARPPGSPGAAALGAPTA